MTQENLKTTFEQVFSFRLNHNQYNELERMTHEISQRDGISEAKLIDMLKSDQRIIDSTGKNKFSAIKQHLIKLRFPLTCQQQKINPKDVFLSELKNPLKDTTVCTKEFTPEKIFIEKSARDSYLANKFKNYFPDCPTEELNHTWEYIQKNKFSLKDLKKPLVFIVNEHWDFIKPCPCTKNHIGCNYWIFNLGFGCPFDCSYCYLQQYTNFPGTVLPANLDDFFNKFDNFYKKINRPIRIGTGEFCDSLALDHITGYSSQLIDFFRDKPVLFELKTKSDNIDNILKCKGSENIIISWSLNPQEIINDEECCVASLKQRLKAAQKVRDQEFSLSFHFDPVIHSPNWEILYKKTIDELYRQLKPPFKWISIGTLRGTRKLKNAAEQRFSQSNIWYGELLLGDDKKLRYPKFLRKDIYSNMVKWIREYDKHTPVYLCMEDEDCWEVMDKPLTSAKQVESYLIDK
ncbi:MAG: hypothetical protein GY853_08965 [PVC group bacterium]|nr:hypothetical protein [PVC group bacterium]